MKSGLSQLSLVCSFSKQHTELQCTLFTAARASGCLQFGLQFAFRVSFWAISFPKCARSLHPNKLSFDLTHRPMCLYLSEMQQRLEKHQISDQCSIKLSRLISRTGTNERQKGRKNRTFDSKKLFQKSSKICSL